MSRLLTSRPIKIYPFTDDDDDDEHHGNDDDDVDDDVDKKNEFEQYWFLQKSAMSLFYEHLYWVHPIFCFQNTF